MATVCVSGGAGMLGSHLCDRLASEGHEVYALDNLLGGEWSNIENDAVRKWKVDCSNFDVVDQALAMCKPDILYHAAAAPHEGLSVFSPAFVTKHTYMTTVSLASAACQHGVKRFCMCSSMARYGVYNLPPYEENWAPHPVDPYGVAKVAGEQVLRQLGETHGMEFCIVVPHSVTGIRQRYWDPYRNVVSIMINRMLQGKQPFIYGTGEQVRCFTFIQDAIESIVKCGFQDGLEGEVINIGPDEDFITVNELARRLAKIIGFDLKPIYMPERPREVKVAYCSSDKARRLLGYKTTISLDQGLTDMVEWIRKKGPREFVYHLPHEITNEKMPETWKKRLF